MMSTQKSALVTSDHKKYRGFTSIVREAYNDSKLDNRRAQRLNEKSGLKEAVMELIAKFSADKHPAADEIECFYTEVLGMTVDLTGVQFPEKVGFTTYMAVAPGLDEDMVMEKITKHFGVDAVDAYTLRKPIASNIDRKTAQVRPEGIYVFAHVGGDEPDTAYLGKSYDDVVAAKMTFANPLEYLLATGFHMWKHGHWMDTKGCWTLTSSLWSDGNLVFVMSASRLQNENRVGHDLHERVCRISKKDKVFIKTLSSGVDFLGWVHFPRHKVLRTVTKRRMLRKVNEKNISSYLGLLKHGNGYGLQNKLEEKVKNLC